MQLEKYKRAFIGLVSCGVLISITVSAYYFFEPNFTRNRMMEERRKEQVQKISDKKKMIETVKIYQERFENDETFVEYIARLNKRIRKNEFIFLRVGE